MRLLAVVALALAPLSASAFCFEQAGARYGISPILLHSISVIENRSGDPRAINKNDNNTVDVGLMQINSRHLEDLARYGVTFNALLDPCTNVMVGAWLLAKHIARDGMTWRAVGSYHSRNPEKGLPYGERVRKQVLKTLAANGS